MKIFILVAAAAIVASLAGCAAQMPSVSEITFHYQPNNLVVDGPRLPVKVAVLPFQDGTENFTVLGSMFDAESLTFNLAKTGIAGIITPVTPELWAKAFADDLAASGRFQAVRFIYSPTELTDEEFSIDGTLEKAYVAGGVTKPSEYVLRLQAVRRADNRPAWQKKISRELMGRKADFADCGTNIQCMADRSHAAMNLLMQGMFAEARADFMATQGVVSGGSAGGGGAAAPAMESADEIIEMILKNK